MALPSLPPLCRYCGARIPKRTRTILFGASRNNVALDGFWVECTARPATREAAQTHTNHRIVSIRWSKETDDQPRYVCSATAWDGETYADRFFCNGDHAKQFAYAMAKSGLASHRWDAAYKAQLQRPVGLSK